jgi:hypothetical protein
MSGAKLKRVKFQKTFEKKQVSFLDIERDFWKLGTCYREDEKFCWVRDFARKRYKVTKNNIKLFTNISHQN